jgi:RimJ/RimL family protein N-acetyltransferase
VFREGDGADLYEYLGDPETVFFEPYDAYTREGADREAARRASDPAFIAVCLGGKLIGNIYFGPDDEPETADIGYIMNRAYWGRGYATEAARAVTGAAFAQGVRRIRAGCAENNPHSWRLLERLGMRLVEKIPHAVTFKKDAEGRDIWLDARRYELVNPI